MAAPASDVAFRDRMKQTAASSAAMHASDAEGSTAPLADHTSCSGVSARNIAAKAAAIRSENSVSTRRYRKQAARPIATALTTNGSAVRTPNERYARLSRCGYAYGCLLYS